MMHYALLNSITRFADGAPASCTKPFLGLKTWFAYFPPSWFGPTKDSVSYGACDINSNFQLLPSNGQSGLLLISLAVIDDLLRIAALVSVGFVVYGGIQFVTSQGSPDATAKARNTIINALIGVAIAVIATGIVSFIGSNLK